MEGADRALLEEAPGASFVSQEEAAAFGEVVALTVPWDAVETVLAGLGSRLGGKILLDCTNPNFSADPDAKNVAAGLATEAGFDPIDVGPLGSADLLESLARLWGKLAYGQGMGRARLPSTATVSHAPGISTPTCA